MARIADIMSVDVRICSPEQRRQQTAQIMRDFDIGALPVCSDSLLLGMVNVSRHQGAGRRSRPRPRQRLRIGCYDRWALQCTEDQGSQEVLHRLGEARIRHLPVGNADKELAGIASLGDLALPNGRS